MANYFKDFMQPAKIIFDRLYDQNNKRVIVNGNDGTGKSSSVVPPYYPDLPEYPCRLIRGSDGKVCEVQYGEGPRGYIWRQLIVRGSDGKVQKIIQENPDGKFDIVLHRTDNKVDLIDLQ